MKDGPISKLTITETEHKSTQYKKVIDTLPALCIDKNYQCNLDDIIQNGIDLVEANFTTPYPDANLWFTTYHVKIRTVYPTETTAGNGSRTPTITMEWQTYIFDANLQKELLLEFKRNFKIKSQEFFKFVANKKTLVMIIFQAIQRCNKDRNFSWSKLRSRLPIRDVNLINILFRLATIISIYILHTY